MARYAALTLVMIMLGVATVIATASPAIAVTSPLYQIKSEVAKLTADIARSQSEITNVDHEVEITTREIIHIYQEIEGHEAKLAQSKELVNARLQDVYKNYDDMVLAVFLNARSFNDLWKSISFLARINQDDNELLAANKFRAEKVQALKGVLAEKKAAQVELKRRKKQEYAELQRAYAVKTVELEKKIAEVREWQARMASMKRVPLNASQ